MRDTRLGRVYFSLMAGLRQKKEAKIQIELNSKKEAPSFPYWLVPEPRQYPNQASHDDVSGHISGPFWTRKAAAQYEFDYGSSFTGRSIVFCISGYYRIDYKESAKKATL